MNESSPAKVYYTNFDAQYLHYAGRISGLNI